MIHEVTGDILLTRAQCIAHGIAPNDHFDQGLALALRERWPAMAKDFRHYAHLVHPAPGEIWAWHGAGGTHIINLLTQQGDAGSNSRPGRATVGYVSHALKRLRHEVEKQGLKSLALPRLATGVGGLTWDEVRPLIVERLGDLAIPVFVYANYQPGVQANEPGVG